MDRLFYIIILNLKLLLYLTNILIYVIKQAVSVGLARLKEDLLE